MTPSDDIDHPRRCGQSRWMAVRSSRCIGSKEKSRVERTLNRIRPLGQDASWAFGRPRWSAVCTTISSGVDGRLRFVEIDPAWVGLGAFRGLSKLDYQESLSGLRVLIHPVKTGLSNPDKNEPRRSKKLMWRLTPGSDISSRPVVYLKVIERSIERVWGVKCYPKMSK